MTLRRDIRHLHRPPKCGSGGTNVNTSSGQISIHPYLHLQYDPMEAPVDLTAPLQVKTIKKRKLSTTDVKEDGTHGIVLGIKLPLEDWYKVQKIFEANLTGTDAQALKNVPHAIKRLISLYTYVDAT